jgi:uncharacterized protein (UPF0276 family)
MSATAVSGVGIGLRWALVEDILERPPPELAWLEVAPENFMRRGGRFPAALARLAERWPVVTHGLAMSLGGTERFDDGYMRTLRGFLREVETPWHSDHLCFGAVSGVAMHDLLPMPFTRAAAAHLAERIRRARDLVDRPFAVENISYYAHPGQAEMDEGDFVSEVVALADCALLLDVNNVYVNAQNHRFDPRAMIAKLPLDRVVQIHVAGHDDSEPDLVIDTHAEPMKNEVLDLLAFTFERTGPVPVLLERDDNFPPWEELSAELRAIARIAAAAGHAPRATGPADAPPEKGHPAAPRLAGSARPEPGPTR